MSRQADRERVDEALERSAPHLRIVTLCGPAGIGKSRILRSVASDWSSAGRPTVRAVGAQFDQHMPLGGVVQLIDELSSCGLIDAPATVGTDQPSNNVELAASAQLIHGLDEIANRDGLVVVDDAHWLDETSRRVIEFALRRLDDRAPATLIAQRHGISMVSFGEHVEATGFSRDEFDEFLQGHGGDVAGGDADRAWEVTGGNPLAAIEWSASGTRAPTIDVGRTVAERIALCTPSERQALCMVAVSRRGDTLADAWRQHAADSADLATVVRASAAADMFEPDAPLRFKHPEYQDAAARCLDVGERSRVSRSLAATSRDDDSAAWHLADACETADDEIARLLGEVARRSLDRGTPIEAARASERACALAFDHTLAVDQLIAAGEAWWYACFPDETARVTAGAWDAPVDLARRVRLRQLHRAAVGWQRTAMETVRGYLDDAALVEASDIDLTAGLRVSAFIEACLAGQPDLAAEIADALSSGLEATRSGSTSPMWSGVISVCRGFAAILRGVIEPDDLDPDRDGDPQRSADLGAIAFFGSLDPTKLETGALNLLQLVGYGDMVLDRRETANRTLTGLRIEAQARGAIAITDFTEACLAELERRSGRWASALSRTMSDIEIDPTRTSAGKAWQRAVRARMLAAQGSGVVEELVASVVDEAGPVGMESITATAVAARATACLAAGDAERACALLADVEATAHRGGALEPGALWFELDQIEALWRCGDLAGVRRVTQRLAGHAARTGRAWSAATASLGAALTGDATVAAADDAAARLAAPFESARAHLLLAEFERQAGGATTIDVPATRERLARLGASPFVQRCDDFGAPTSAATEDVITSGILTELTPAELRVAVSVGAGRTNSEAAEELFLSARTVEAHLRSIFRKLDIRNRVELATVVATADSSSG